MVVSEEANAIQQDCLSPSVCYIARPLMQNKMK